MKLALLLLLLLFITPVYAQVGERISDIITQSLAQQIGQSIICGNDVCQEGESHLSCPDDCTNEITELNPFMIIIIIGIIFIALRRKKR